MKNTLHRAGGVIYAVLCLMISGMTVYLLVHEHDVSGVLLGIIMLTVLVLWAFYLWNWVLRE